MKRLITVAYVAFYGGGVALAQNAFFSEIGANPPGIDSGYEYIELEGVPSSSASPLKIVIIDGKAGNQGTVLKVIDLASAGNFGGNGLLLVRPPLDGANGIYEFFPYSTAFTNTFFTNQVSDMANGSQTYLLGTGTPPALGNIMTGPKSGFTVYDSVAYKHSASDSEYAVSIASSNGTNLGTKPFLTGVLYRQITGNSAKGGWAGGLMDLGYANPGPYRWKNGSFFGPSGWTYVSPVNGPDPGIINTRSRTIAGTLAISPGQYVGTAAGTQAFTFKVYSPPDTLRQTQVVNLTPSGAGSVAWSFTLGQSIKSDQIQIRVKGPTFLAKRTSNLNSATQTSAIAFTLLNGDVDNDNYVGTDDYLLMSSAFDTSTGDLGFLLGADLDKDGFVGTDDYLILSANFDNGGDQ